MTTHPDEPFVVAVIMPYGGAAVRSLLEGRITRQGRLVVVSKFESVSDFRQCRRRPHALLVSEHFFDELTTRDVDNAKLVIMRKSRYTLRRDRFRFAGADVDTAEVPNDMLRLLPIDGYRKGPYHRRLLWVALCVLLIAASLLIWWGAP